VDLPRGVVTFLFSDIEGSTRLWESDPERMRRSLARHDELVADVVSAAGGHIFKHTGDGFGAAFASVSAALDGAAGVAAAIAAEEWPGTPLVSRLGVHSGEAEPSHGDYFGPTVTRTARLTGAANGGQILVSESSHGLVDGLAPAGSTFVEAGIHRLKDLGEPMGLYRLVGPGATDERQLRTLETAPHNLPIQLSSFVGREAQIKEIADLVRSSRLVTLTGIGGVGKTRLSLQVAAETLADFDDGAWLVELAPLAEAGLIADTVAEDLDITPDGTVTADALVVRHLAKRSALLVIDNCEHLIDDVAAFVERVLRACPDVHVLATSREGLAVRGEVLWRVPSLRVDEDAAAVELFAERARLVRSDFVVDDDNRDLVARLCMRLDGIPLAIELATARLQMLTLEQIAEHLADRFRLLTGGSRTAVERQRTLRAMMDWSYDLLPETEQTLLNRLSVFMDGFTLEAAEEVCSDESVAELDVLDLLQGLVEASMVTFETDPKPRYRLLETVRQYSLDKLVEAGDADRVRQMHADYFRRLAVDLQDRLLRDDPTAMDDGQIDLGNYRVAMTWAAEAGQGEMLLELAVGLRMFFWNRVMYREAVRWLMAGIDLATDRTSILFDEAVAFALTDARNGADGAAIAALFPLAEERYEAATEDLPKGTLANAIAAATQSTDFRRADALFKSAHEMLRRAGSPRWGAPLQNRFITALFMDSRESEAEVLGLAAEAVAEGVSIHQEVMEIGFMAIAEKYEAVIERVEAYDGAVGDWEHAMMLLFRVLAERGLGRLEEARESIDRAAAILGPNSPGNTEWQKSMIELGLGNVDAAVAAFRMPSTDDRLLDARGRVLAAAFWALVSERKGDHETAAVLWGAEDRMKELSSFEFPRFQREFESKARQRSIDALGDDRFAELVDRGRETPWEDLPLVRGTGSG